MFAAKNGDLDVVKILLEHNADVQAKGSDGEYQCLFSNQIIEFIASII